MTLSNTRQPGSVDKHLAALEDYKDKVIRLFPALPRQALNAWSIATVDALALGYFLDYVPREVFVFEIGTFVGVSTFFFASHKKVSKVVTVDPNPSLSDQLTANSDRWEREVDLEALGKVRVVDVARSALEEFDDLRVKIEFREGVVGSSSTGVKRAPEEGLKKLEVPACPEAKTFITLVDGLHTREGVREDLTAIFEKNPDAIVFLDDCRYSWGQFVQAGVVDFIEKSDSEYTFDLVGDLSRSLATSSLGIVYPHPMAKKVKDILNNLRRVFSERLDPLRLLERETELITEVNRINGELDKVNRMHRELNEELRKSKGAVEMLEAILSRRTHKAADAAANAILHVPGAKKLLARKHS